jgi:DNA polymerase-1
VDSETTGLLPHQGDLPFAISMTTNEGEDWYVRFEVDPFTRKVKYTLELNNVIGLLTSRSSLGLKTIFHNASFDLAMLYAACLQEGIKWSPLEDSRQMPMRGVLDTVILAHAANSARESYALKPLCEQLLNIPMGDQSDLQASAVEKRRDGKKAGYKLAKDVDADYHLADPELCKTYAIQDTRRTMALFKIMRPLVEDGGEGPFSHLSQIVEMEHRFQMAILELNIRGVRVDLKRTKELEEYYKGVIDTHTKEMEALGFGDLNPRSPKQKNEVFYEQLGFTPEKRKRKGKDGATKQTISVDKKALEKFSSTSPLAACLLNISEAQHQLNSFILPFQREAVEKGGDHFLYPNFNSVGPRTGRVSCVRPNLQNVTSETSPTHKTSVELLVRECFIPRRGMAWMLADYAQVEIWVAAYLSKDVLMCKTLEAGESVHDITCDRAFGHKPDFKENRPMYRKMAKILTFSILYGSGPKAIADLLSVTYEEAKVYYTNFWKTYGGLRIYADNLQEQIKRKGYVKDKFGRVFFIPKDKAYKSLNYVIQGTAAGILKRAHLAVNELLKSKYPNFKIILTVHDEILLEFPMAEINQQIADEILKTMSGNYHKLLGMLSPFPVEASYVIENWGKKLKL